MSIGHIQCCEMSMGRSCLLTSGHDGPHVIPLQDGKFTVGQADGVKVEALPPGETELAGDPGATKCPDCKGSKRYEGLNEAGPCLTCCPPRKLRGRAGVDAECAELNSIANPPSKTPTLSGNTVLTINGVKMGPEIKSAELHPERPGWVNVVARESELRESRLYEVEICPTKTYGVCRLGRINAEGSSGGLIEISRYDCPTYIKVAACRMWEQARGCGRVIKWEAARGTPPSQFGSTNTRIRQWATEPEPNPNTVVGAVFQTCAWYAHQVTADRIILAGLHSQGVYSLSRGGQFMFLVRDTEWVPIDTDKLPIGAEDAARNLRDAQHARRGTR